MDFQKATYGLCVDKGFRHFIVAQFCAYIVLWVYNNLINPRSDLPTDLRFKFRLGHMSWVASFFLIAGMTVLGVRMQNHAFSHAVQLAPLKEYLYEALFVMMARWAFCVTIVGIITDLYFIVYQQFLLDLIPMHENMLLAAMFVRTFMFQPVNLAFVWQVLSDLSV